jgi:pimeloyl-ACP methyl ester carboxylesterase
MTMRAEPLSGEMTRPLSGFVSSDGCELYWEAAGDGVPILLVHPAGSTTSTWGQARDQLARYGHVLGYDRRGYARSAAAPVRSLPQHTADAAALLESLVDEPAVVVGTSAGAAIAVDLAVRRPELVRTVVAHEFPWRFTRHVPSASQLVALLRIGSFSARRRPEEAVDALLRSAYAYKDGTSAWDGFPEQWRNAARENARPALADFLNSIRSYPSAAELASIEVPVLCTCGTRSPDAMFRLVRLLAAAIPGSRLQRIEGAGHAAPFDAPANFVRVIAEAISSASPQP